MGWDTTARFCEYGDERSPFIKVGITVLCMPSGHTWWMTAFLTSALDGGGWSASRTGRFTPGKKSSGTHRIGRSVGPQGPSGRFGEEKNVSHMPEFESFRQQPMSLYTLSYPTHHHHQHH